MISGNTLRSSEQSEQLHVRWYAVRVRSRCEVRASESFRQRGLTAFNPTYRSARQWSDRVKQLDLPLFPGYVFCRFDASEPLSVLTTAGVVHIVSAGPSPLPVDDKEMDAVRSICESGLPVAPAAPVAVGQEVTVIRGPLAGVDGKVVQIKEASRLIAEISLLQRAVSVELDRSWIDADQAPRHARPAVAASNQAALNPAGRGRL